MSPASVRLPLAQLPVQQTHQQQGLCYPRWPLRCQCLTYAQLARAVMISPASWQVRCTQQAWADLVRRCACIYTSQLLTCTYLRETGTPDQHETTCCSVLSTQVQNLAIAQRMLYTVTLLGNKARIRGKPTMIPHFRFCQSTSAPGTCARAVDASARALGRWTLLLVLALDDVQLLAESVDLLRG